MHRKTYLVKLTTANELYVPYSGNFVTNINIDNVCMWAIFKLKYAIGNKHVAGIIGTDVL